MSTVSEITVRPDSKGRIALGKLAKGVSSYRLHQETDGRLILEPFVEIPERERWLYKNPAALAAVEEGLRDVAAGRIVSLGSFAQYADDDLEQE
jgi:predicted transcriptional regulator